MSDETPIYIPDMIPDELHHAFGRALRILHAFAKAGVQIDGEEIPTLFLLDLANKCRQDTVERLYESFPRDWELVYPQMSQP